MALGMEVGLGAGQILLDGDPANSQKGGISIVVKQLDASRCHSIWW